MDTNGAIDGQLIIRATAAAGLAKTGVDVIRTQTNLWSWVSPVAAFVLSFVILFGLSEASGLPVATRQAWAATFIGACISTPMAIGATAVQSAVERRSSDRKIAEVQDAAQAQQERLVNDVVPNVARAVTDANAIDLPAVMRESARQGAQKVIDELRATQAA